MQQLDIPSKIVLPFAADGGRNVVPVDSLIGTLPGRASYQDGFPPLTRTPKASGGIPPAGLDMNGVMYDLSAVIRWANAGGGFPFDQAFADDANVGGYPAGARVMRSDGTGYWLNTVDDNTTDPEDAGAAAAGWVPDFTNGAAAITMTNANVTLTPLQYGKPLIVITGTLAANLNLVFPPIPEGWTVINNTTGSYTITAKTAAGTGVTLGTITQIIGDGTNMYAANPDAIQRVSNVATLRNINPVLTRRVQTAGYYTDGDGGGAQFVPKTGAAPGTYVDNGGSIIVPTGGDGSAAWVWDATQQITVERFGAKGDGTTDDWASIQAALNYAQPLYLPTYFNAVKYACSRPLVCDDGQQLIGRNREATIIEKTGTLGPSPSIGSIVVVRGGNNYTYNYDQNAIVIVKKPAARSYPNGLRFDNITFQGKSGVTVDYGVYAPRLARSHFSDVYINNVTNGWLTYDTFTCAFERVDIWNVSNGFKWDNDGSGQGSGTSCTFMACGVNFASVSGWQLYGLTYSNIIGSFSESINGGSAGSRPVAWFFLLCRGLNVVGCGSEVVKGYTFRISAGSVNIEGGDYSALTGDTFSADTAVISLDSGAKVHVGGGTRFQAVTSPGNIYNEIVIGSGSQLIYDGTVTRPSGGNTNPLFTSGGEIVVLGQAGEGYTRQDSTGTFYAVESSTTGTTIPTSNFTLKNGVAGFSFGCVLEPSANDRKLRWTNSSANASGGWEFYSEANTKVRLGVYNDGSLSISPPTSTSATSGGASALPGTPQGYITVNIDGTNRKIPYYNT